MYGQYSRASFLAIFAVPDSVFNFFWNLDVYENSFRDFPSITIWNTLMSCDPRISARMEQSYGAMGSKPIIEEYLKFY